MSEKVSRVLKPAEVAAMFAVSTRTINRWVEEGLLQKYGINCWFTPAGDARFDEAEVKAAILANRTGQATLRSTLLEKTNIDKAHVYAVSNAKGGVGKTTSTVHLAVAIAELTGDRVLVIDLDPQGNATSHFGYSNREDELENGFLPFEHTVADLWNDFMGEGDPLPLDQILLPTAHERVELAPMDHDGLEIEHALTFTMLQWLNQDGHRLIDGQSMRDVIYRFYLTFPNALDLMLSGNPFDWVLIDTPPTLGPLTAAALIACDGYLVPVEPEKFSLDGLLTFKRLANSMLSFIDEDAVELGYIINRKARLTEARRKTEAQIREAMGDLVFQTTIGEDTQFISAAEAGKPLMMYSASSSGSKAFMELAQEVIERVRIKTEATN